jgi:hypothetical protein
MDANELRALQAPLKKQYREQPATALTPSRAEAMLDMDRSGCRVRSWGGETDAGLHPATGGDGNLACSADMMLEALVARAGVTVSAVATAMGVKLRGGRVVAEGHWARAARWAWTAKRRSASRAAQRDDDHRRPEP